MTNTDQPSNRPEFRSGPLITGAALIGAGSLLVMAGLALGSSHLFSTTRQWIRAMEVPPSELAKLRWAQARAAAAAGADAWQKVPASRPATRL